jgi:hypothetical protein
MQIGHKNQFPDNAEKCVFLKIRELKKGHFAATFYYAILLS